MRAHSIHVTVYGCSPFVNADQPGQQSTPHFVHFSKGIFVLMIELMLLLREIYTGTHASMIEYFVKTFIPSDHAFSINILFRGKILKFEFLKTKTTTSIPTATITWRRAAFQFLWMRIVSLVRFPLKLLRCRLPYMVFFEYLLNMEKTFSSAIHCEPACLDFGQGAGWKLENMPAASGMRMETPFFWMRNKTTSNSTLLLGVATLTSRSAQRNQNVNAQGGILHANNPVRDQGSGSLRRAGGDRNLMILN